MSVEAQLTAILRNQADQTSTKQLDDFLSILNQNQVLSVLNLVQTFIDTLYHTQKFTFDWIKLITALLRCSNTRHETFLLLIKKIQADAFPDRDRFTCTGELHMACIQYECNRKEDIGRLRLLVKAILQPPATVFSKSASLEPSAACLALIDLLSTMINGRRTFSTSNTGNHNSGIPILAVFDSNLAPSFQSTLINFIVDQQTHISLIPALVTVLMESPLLESQQIRWVSTIRKSLEQHILNRSSSGATPISLIPSWIQSSIIRACFFFLHPKSKFALYSDISSEASWAWFHLLRSCIEISVIPWTMKSCHRDLQPMDADWRAESVDPEFDPSVVLVVLDLQIRQSFDVFVVLLNQYARMATGEYLNENEQHLKSGSETSSTNGSHVLETTVDQPNRPWSVEPRFGAQDLVFLCLLLHSSTYQQPVLRLWLTYLSSIVSARSMDDNITLVREMMNIPGFASNAGLLLKAVLHCVDASSYTRLTQLGINALQDLHTLASEMLCALFLHQNQRRAILTLCFSPSQTVSAWVPRRQRDMHRQIAGLRDEFACGTLEKIASSHTHLLLPLTKLIVEFLPYLSTSHPHNTRLCCRLISAVIPLAKLDLDFQTNLIIFLRKLLVTRSVMEGTMALHGVSTLLSQQIVSSEVQIELFEMLSQSARLPKELHSMVYECIIYITYSLMDQLGETRKESNLELENMAFQIMTWIKKAVADHWTTEEITQNNKTIAKYNFHFRSFFEPTAGSAGVATVPQPKSCSRYMIQLLALGCKLYKSTLTRSRENATSMAPIPWPLHLAGHELLNTLVSTMNGLGNVSWTVLEVLGVLPTSISNLSRRLTNIDSQYSLLALNLHELPERPDMASDEPIVGSELVSVGSAVALDSIPPNIRVQTIIESYTILAEALFEEGRNLSKGGESFIITSENSSLSLSTAFTKGLFLLELRASMQMHLKLSNKSDMSVQESDTQSLFHSINHFQTLSLTSIAAILRRFNLPETIVEGKLSPKDELISFLPKPSLVALYDVLGIANQQLKLLRSTLSASNSSETRSKEANATNKSSNFASVLPTEEEASSIIHECFSILILLESQEDKEQLPPDVNLNAIVEILILNQLDCIQAASKGCHVRLLGILESMFSLATVMKWDLQDLIYKSLDQFYDFITITTSNSSVTKDNQKKRSREEPREPESQSDTDQGLQETAAKRVSQEPSNSNDVAPPMPRQEPVTSGLLCLYFTNRMIAQMAQEQRIAENYVPLMISLAAVTDRKGSSQVETASTQERDTQSNKYVVFSCSLILQFLSTATVTLNSLFRLLLNYSLHNLPNEQFVVILSTALVERVSNYSKPMRLRTDSVELALIGWIKNIDESVQDTFRDVALDLALDRIYTYILRSTPSNVDQWLASAPMTQLILMSLRKMAISPSVSPTPRIWIKYLLICSRFYVDTKRWIRSAAATIRSDEKHDQVMTEAMAGAQAKSYLKEDEWSSEGYLTTFLTFGLFLRHVAQRLESSMDKRSDMKLPLLLRQVQSFEELCSQIFNENTIHRKRKRKEPAKDWVLETFGSDGQVVAEDNRSKIAFAKLARDCLLDSLSDYQKLKSAYERANRSNRGPRMEDTNVLDANEPMDVDEESYESSESSWDSDIDSEDEESGAIHLKQRAPSGANRRVMRSANAFIDNALQEEEFLFQDEDDYADLADWIDDGEDDDVPN